ncbi:MAG TPA: selenocysteine-specific translation elongation factor [Anaerolineales bacterium]|nr:selenocysteine-specific translation elongation factor [Anaerolineales bacterium]
MRVIGTAGHVDHGKSTLVQALTGTHPDRLKEEREREMTIDLGFAWLALPNGEEIGIVDVPGHRDFIENMLAGVGGIDASLFVIAADEGLMPQTREHLAILDLLQIPGGVVALTKVDLIDDPDWLDLVEDDIRQALRGTVLEKAPIQRVSARTRQGLPELLSAIGECLAERPPRPDLGKPRLPVDRVFTMPGFGTVVTGTLSDGCLRLGDDVEILPAGLNGRVRGLQTHKRKADLAVPGSRTAVNISGVDLEQVLRGSVVAHPGDYQPTRRLDVRFRLLPDVTQPLRHSTEVKFYIGAAEVVARLRLLGGEELLPGEEGWLQLEMDDPVVAVRGDRYILRRPSPGETLGGGSVLDPHPKGRHKRFAQAVLERLNALAQGTPAEVLMQSMVALGAAPLQEVLQRSSLEAEVARQALSELLAGGQLVSLEGDVKPEAPLAAANLVTSLGYWNQLAARLLAELDGYHAANPLRRGLPREELKSRLKLPVRLFNAALRKLINQGDVTENGPLVLRPGHTIRLNPQQQRQVEALLKRFAAAPYAPPVTKECQAELGEDLYNALLELGELVFVPPDVVFRRSDYEHMVAEVRRLITQKGAVTAAEVRDHFNTSRRYVLAFLEHLDALGITVRDGDARRLKK